MDRYFERIYRESTGEWLEGRLATDPEQRGLLWFCDPLG